MAFGKFDPFKPGKGPAFGGNLKKLYRRRPIWFAGAGDVQASWCSLCDQSPGGGDPVPRMEGVACDHRLCTELRQLEKKCKFDKYVALVEGLLYASIHRKGVSRPHDLLWRQLVVATSIFCQKSVDQGQFKKSLRMLRKAHTLLDKQDAIFFMGEQEFQVLRKELLAYITDFSSYHYWKRGKHEAAIQDCKKVDRREGRARIRVVWCHVCCSIYVCDNQEMFAIYCFWIDICVHARQINLRHYFRSLVLSRFHICTHTHHI